MNERDYQVAGLQGALACYPDEGDCVIIDCARCRIAELEKELHTFKVPVQGVIDSVDMWGPLEVKKGSYTYDKFKAALESSDG